MTCLHNHDQILEFLRNIFLKGFQIYQNYLCALMFYLSIHSCTYLLIHVSMCNWVDTQIFFSSLFLSFFHSSFLSFSFFFFLPLLFFLPFSTLFFLQFVLLNWGKERKNTQTQKKKILSDLAIMEWKAYKNDKWCRKKNILKSLYEVVITPGFITTKWHTNGSEEVQESALTEKVKIDSIVARRQHHLGCHGNRE